MFKACTILCLIGFATTFGAPLEESACCACQTNKGDYSSDLFRFTEASENDCNRCCDTQAGYIAGKVLWNAICLICYRFINIILFFWTG